MAKQKLGIFNWDIPENIYLSGAINCSREFGGCGRWHSFDLDERGEIEFDLSWENSKGEFECEKFSDWLEAEAREEWESEFKERFLWEQEQSQEVEQLKQEFSERQEKIKAGVKLDERQFEKEWGAVRPVGFYKQRREIFICGNCSKELKGSLRNGIAKNRNNPVFWGLVVSEKILCGECLEARKGAMPAPRRKKFVQYGKLGMFRD